MSSAVPETLLGTVFEPFRAALREHLLRSPETVCVTDREHIRIESLPVGRRTLLCTGGDPAVAGAFVEACERGQTGLVVVELAPGGDGFERRSATAFSLARTVPGATVIDCGDATETETVLDAVAGIEAPVYIRARSGLVPILFETPLEPYRARLLSRGRDLCLISSSRATWEASEAALALRAAGIGITHLHVSTLRPLDDPVVARGISGTRGVVTLEPAGSAGLLGSAIAEVIARHGLGRRHVSLFEGAPVEQAALRLIARGRRRPSALSTLHVP